MVLVQNLIPNFLKIFNLLPKIFLQFDFPKVAVWTTALAIFKQKHLIPFFVSGDTEIISKLLCMPQFEVNYRYSLQLFQIRLDRIQFGFEPLLNNCGNWRIVRVIYLLVQPDYSA